MGILDVKIDIARGSHWKDRNQRIEKLRTRTIQVSTHPELDSREDHGKADDMNLELYWAAAKSDVDGFINVLERVVTEKELSLPAILDSVSPLGNTLLHVAASFGNEETARLLAYQYPHLLTKQNSKGNTALHIAAKSDEGKVAASLISLGRDAAPDNGGTTTEAITCNDRLLNIRNEDGNTAMHEALINRHKWVAMDLIEADQEEMWLENNEGESSLYLAAEAGFSMLLSYVLANPSSRERNLYERIKGKSPVHAAIMGKNIDVLDVILKYEPRFIHLRDEEGRTPLHLAASIGYLEGVRTLLEKYVAGAIERDGNGLFPVHWASVKGHVDVIGELLRHCPDPRELLDHNDQNILHVAAKAGKQTVVSYVLGTSELDKLINGRDKDGNTPLHLATVNWHPKIVSTLTWDERVDLKSTNKEGLTALNAAELYMGKMPPFRQRLTWAALKAAGAPRAPSEKVFELSRETSMQSEPPNMDNYRDRVNTLLLVSTLIATVTFAAGFTMPGGYNSSEPDQGMATMVGHKKFHLFIFCDTIAMYSSILVAISLIWAQLGDLKLVLIALTLAQPLLGIALTMMSSAFMAGVYLVVGKLNWLANSVLIMGLVFLVALLTLFFPLCFPISSSYRFLRYVSYYPFCLLVLVSRSHTS